MNSGDGEDKVSKLDSWLSVAKNFIWIIGLILVAIYKFQEQENTNLNQDLQIRAMREEYRYYDTKLDKTDSELHALQLELNTLKAKQEFNREYRR